MKKLIAILMLTLVVGVTLNSFEAAAQMGPGMMGHGNGMGPGMMGHRYGMGAGMMGPGYGMGPGMMGYGYGMGPGMMGPCMMMCPCMLMRHGMMGHGYGMGPDYYDRYGKGPEKLNEKDAKEIVENYLKATNNPNLKLGKVNDVGNAFEAEIVTKENSLVDKLLVDKFSGGMRSIY